MSVWIHTVRSPCKLGRIEPNGHQDVSVVFRLDPCLRIELGMLPPSGLTPGTVLLYICVLVVKNVRGLVQWIVRVAIWN